MTARRRKTSPTSSPTSPRPAPRFRAATERIATFDNDGTLWTEKPIYFQVVFALDRVRAMAPQHPEWRKKQPFKAAIDNDRRRWRHPAPRAFFKSSPHRKPALRRKKDWKTIYLFEEAVKDVRGN